MHWSQMACLSKTAGLRAKLSEIWDSETLVTHIWITFDLVGFNVILGSLGALFSKWPVSRKRLVVEQNGSEVWDSGSVVIHIWGTFDLIVFKVIWGHSVRLSVDLTFQCHSRSNVISKCPVTRKPLVVQ